MNIVDLVKDQLTSQVLGSLGSLVGTNEAQTKAATAAAVPAMLGGLAKLAGTSQGAGQLASALGGLDLGMLGNLAGVLGGSNASKMADKGGSLLGTLFGNSATSMIVETLASFLGIKGGIARSMLSYLAPVVLGTVAKQLTSSGKSIDAAGIQSLFSDQSSNIQSALPAGLSLGDFGSIAKAVTSATSGGASHSSHASHGHVERQPESSGFPSWLPWLALPLIALTAFLLMNKDKGAKPADKGATVVNPTDMMKKMAEGQKAGEALAEKAAAQVADAGAEAVKTTTDAVAAVVEKATDAIDMTAFGGDMTGLFGKLTDSFKGITDVPSAEAAVPGLKDLAGLLEGYKATADKLPEAGKATVKEMVGTNLGTLQPIIDTVLAIPGVGDILRPIVEPMLKTLSAFGL
ncbi:MAG: DUF937 domain-containing protein [Planctomycetota bacterium]|nr:MAG: DUF937 domain-containing protein [Planctomycetota bacterium]